jgi:hypothetical protein
LGEASLWPLQPEPAAPSAKIEPSLRVEPRAEPPRPETPVRERRTRAGDALAGLAEELSRVAPAGEPGGTGERAPLRRPVRPQPAVGAGDAKSAAPAPPAPDPNLTEMAQRLEAALRRPVRGVEKGPERSDGARPGEAAAKPLSDAATPTPAVAEPAPAASGAPGEPGAPGAPQKSAYDNLEAEMASLLGRPTGKP